MDSGLKFPHWGKAKDEEVTQKDSGTRRTEGPGQAREAGGQANPPPT